jgi:hypothetical protein
MDEMAAHISARFGSLKSGDARDKVGDAGSFGGRDSRLGRWFWRRLGRDVAIARGPERLKVTVHSSMDLLGGDALGRIDK